MAVAEPLVIVGAGGHARVVADVARLAGYRVVGFLDDVDPERRDALFAGATILGGREQLPGLVKDGVRRAFVAVGDCAARLQLAEAVAIAGLECPVLVHPRAVRASDSAIGAGSVLIAGAVVNSGAALGCHVIVNTGASVDHDCEIDDGVHVAVGARLAGHVSVGRGAWIGMGALVRERVRIGAGSLVGAGALVLKDLPGEVVAYGSPAKVIQHVSRQRSSHH